MKHAIKSGFTLIEVLASMAVLLILVLIMGRLFNDSIVTWKLGTRRVEGNTEARAILDFISRDLSQAVADDVLAFRLESEDKIVFGTSASGPNAGWYNDCIWFVSLGQDPDVITRRNVREVWYYVDDMVASNGTTKLDGRYKLMRATKTDAADCYSNYEFWNNSVGWDYKQIAENVGSFELWCYGVSNSPAGPVYTNVPDFNSPSKAIYTAPYSDWFRLRGFQYHKLPAYVEILFTTLEEDDAIKAAEMFKIAKASGTGFDPVKTFVNRQARRHEIRVNMMNAGGYGPGR